MARALLVVPPFIKYNAGPLLGPALLQAAAETHGHDCSTLDLNAIWMHSQLNARAIHDGKNQPDKLKPLFQGDHNKPLDGSLYRAQCLWNSTLFGASTSIIDARDCNALSRRLRYGFLNHGEVEAIASCLLMLPFGAWVQEQLIKSYAAQLYPGHDMDAHPIDVVGVSLLHVGQVIPAVIVSMLV